MLAQGAGCQVRKLCWLALGGLLVAAPMGSAQAGGLFEALFPGLRFRPPVFRPWLAPRHRPAARRAAPKVEFVSLPPADEIKPAKPAVAPTDAELVASILNDSTLRRGDIVVFPTGPKVFKGTPKRSHAMADFEDLHTSSAIAAGARTEVLARTGTTDPRSAKDSIRRVGRRGGDGAGSR
jgi:hypothetical protein